MAQIERDPTGGEKDFTLVCSWNAIETNSSLRYNVEWFIDDTIVQEDHLNNSFNRAYMSRSLLKALPYATRVCCRLSDKRFDEPVKNK